MSGAWVRRARLQAADGMPMPTKQMSLLRSARAAAIVITSLALEVMGISLRRHAQARAVDGESLRSLLEHVRLRPRQKAVAVAGDRVPRLIIGIVALVVAVRIGGMRAARHARDGADAPTRQDHRVGAALPEIIDDLLDRHERAFRRQHPLFLPPDDAFAEPVAGAVRRAPLHL